jgi:prolyl-tRNA synthetase
VKLSHLFVKTRKDFPRDEVSVSSQFLIKAGYIDKLASGVYTLLPFGLKVCNKISRIIREEMENLGASEILMPGLIPKERWEKTGRWESFDALFKIKGVDEKEYALGATHEEVISPLAKQFIFSYKNLPFGIFQIQNKFRNEVRAKSGVLRTKEFIMKDLYSFHANQDCLDGYYEKAKKAYWKIFERCGIKDKTYMTFASGGSFAKYSHEFQTETEAGEDEIFVCRACKTGLNKEILDGDFKCPNCGKTEYDMVKAVEVGNIFKLADKYSKPFGLDFIDKAGKTQTVLMGCYGIGIQRLMGTVAEVSRDKDGLIWPEQIAPYRIYLIALEGKEKEGEELYRQLSDKGVEVVYDDREDVSAGEKFADCDLLGIPYRVILSKKTGENAELKKRSEKELKVVSKKDLMEKEGF